MAGLSRLSIRSVLGLLIEILGFLLVAVSVGALVSAVARNGEARRVATLTATSQQLFAALLGYRLERGTELPGLIANDPANDASERRIANNRKLSEDAYADALHRLAGIELAGLPEVTSLATQTAKATGNITAQIDAIQSATGGAVEAIRAIGQTISQVNQIAIAIASAIEQQGAATKEIARNVQQASAGTAEASANIAGVTEAVSETGAASTHVLESAAALARLSTALRSEVDSFVARIRTA